MYIKTKLNDEYIIDVLTMFVIRDDVHIISKENESMFFPENSILELRMCE